jgi:hypothetical protein
MADGKLLGVVDHEALLAVVAGIESGAGASVGSGSGERAVVSGR